MPREIEVKSILNRKKRRDDWFLDEYTLNLYSSCAFNCLYCYIRGSKYGLNLETSLSAKVNAIRLLEKQLAMRAKKGQYGIIVLSSATDPYLKIDEHYRLTRQALALIAKYRFPVHMITKSNGIERDFDLLHEIDECAILPEDLRISLNRGVIVSFSFSTLDDAVGKIFEPGAPAPSIRLETMKKTIDEGFLTGVSLMPLLPFISDTTAHLELLFSSFKEAKVDYVLPATITLFGNEKADSKTLVMNAIRNHFPELEKRYTKYFGKNTEMPSYYTRAFRKKMEELFEAYNLPNGILQGAATKPLSARIVHEEI